MRRSAFNAFRDDSDLSPILTMMETRLKNMTDTEVWRLSQPAGPVTVR